MKKRFLIGIFTSLMVLFLCGCGAQSDTLFVSADGEKEPVQSVGIGTEGQPAVRAEEETVLSAGSDAEMDESGPVASDVADEQDVCYVHVCGAVRNPGVYRLPTGARIFEAIEEAGGVTKEAYADGVNQALPVSDGDMIRVPTVEEWEKQDAGMFNTGQDSGADGTISPTTYDDGLVNINTADVSALCTLPGIGETRAEAIIAYRAEHGNFASIEDIQNVSGIKAGLYSKIKDKIKV